MKKILQQLRKEIRFLRKSKNLTLADLAERSNLNIEHISGIERGLRTPSMQGLISRSDNGNIKTSQR